MTAARSGVLAKVCGVGSIGDATDVAAAGADFMGVILSPGFSRSVEVARAARLYEAAPGARRAGVFVDASPLRVAEAARALALDVVQLSGVEAPVEAAAIAAAGPWRVWKTVHVRPGASLRQALAPYADVADGIVLDAWDPDRPGGTGVSFDWAAAGRRVRSAMGSATFVAAGGMNPGNAAAAIAALRPDVLDVSSGVEAAPGAKDARLVHAFVAAVRGASARAAAEPDRRPTRTATPSGRD